MDVFITRYCLSLLLLTAIATSTASNGTGIEEPREPRVSGRIVKLYSGAKPEPYICTGEGFQADYSNCAVFYRCVKERSGKYTVFRYQCAPGTVYDPDLETCNHPRNTRRSECGGVLKPTAQPFHPTNINEIDGEQSEVPRPITSKVPVYTEQSTLKNPTTLSWILTSEHKDTQMPWVSTTFKPSSTLIAGNDKITKFSSTSTGYPWSSTYRTEYTTRTSPPKTSQHNDPCTSDGFMGDSENCRKFYRCVGNQRGGYIKYEFSCSELTVWDDEIQGCNHPWAVKRSKCGRSMSYAEQPDAGYNPTESTSSTSKESTINGTYGYKSNKTVQQQLQISHGAQVTQTQMQISNSNNVIQNQTQIHYGAKLNNTKISNSGSKQNQTQISSGTAVSQTQTQIDYGNMAIQTQLQIDHSKDSSQSQVQIQDTTTVQSATKPQSNNECSESGFIGDANDCKKFYRCVNNGRGTYTKYEYICGDGTVWDPEIEACNHAWAVKHCGGKLPPDTTSNGNTTTATSTMKSTEYYHTEATKTTQNYHSTSQIPDVDDGDDDGYGNQNIQENLPSSISTSKPMTTTLISTTTTGQLNEISTECKASGFIGDANNCKLFYRCVENGRGGYTKYEFKCGDGTVWDPDIEACNHEWAVKKCGSSSSSTVNKEETSTQKENTTPSQQVQTTVTLTQITSQAPAQIEDYDTGYGSHNSEPSTTTSRTTKQPQGLTDDSNNECKSSGFMGDQNDCKKFYRCVDNGSGGYIRYEFTCGESTVWDPSIEACNHAWAVDKCGGSNNVANNIETTSLSTLSTSYEQTSHSHTTQVIKETDAPIYTSTTTARSPTASAISSSKCTKSGFMGDNTNCKKFYRCVDNGDGSYIRYEFTCGEGTVWDSEIEACNHAWAVDKCGSHSETTHTTLKTTSQHAVMQDEEQENGYVSPSYETSGYPPITTTTLKTNSLSPTTISDTSKCTNSGFMSDKINCKKFYRCVDNGKGGYDRYEFQCGEGTVWDSSIEACNHAWAVKDCGVGISGSSSTQAQIESTTQSTTITTANGQTQHSTEKPMMTTQHHQENELLSDECAQEGFFGNQEDCKKFYRCVDNGNGGYTKYDFTCGEGTSWNPEIQGCDHVNPNRPCSTKPSQEPIYLNDDMDIPTSTTTKATTILEATETTKTTKKPEASEGTCESDGFYANPSDCRKFYRCVDNGNGGFTKYDFNCGQGTVWNQEIQACDHESADKTCVKSSSTTESTVNQSESTTSSYSTTKKQQTTDKTETSENTEDNCTSEGFFAHPSDCKKFVRCVSNDKGGYTRYEFSCGDGTVWVQEIQACDHDNGVVSCKSQGESTVKPQNTKEQPSHTSNVMSSSTESMTPSREDDEYDSEPPKKPTQDRCTSEGYFANKDDCRKFYRCVNNGNGRYTKYDFVCGEGTAWDQDLQTCNYINEVKSCNGNNQLNHQESETHQTTTNKNQAETESTSSTSKSTPSSESSGSNLNNQATCESEGFYGDSKDCKKFYRCVDNGKGGYTKYDFTCGDGTIWDQDITTCNHPQDVSNPSCGSTQESSGTSSSTSTTTSSSQTTTTIIESSSNTTDCPEASSKKPTNNNITCDKAGYYANPNDCKKFYRCVDWDGDGKRFSVFHFECGEGTIWDPALDTCNYEDSVYPQRDCTKTQSQNVSEATSTEGTTSTTTIESTTSEQTTEESTTSKQTTTKEPITSESTTTQQTTTQQTTVSEITTNQESTTSESSTSQQTTTSEKTTTQEAAASENTTTQQPITSDKTTTQEPTTSEQTTTQQTTTSEITTTQEPTTSEQTTTQQTTTTEKTTTQEPTTSVQATTQQSTTTEITTIQEQTISEHTTTTQDQTTTEQTTTEQTTTTENTSQQSTTSEKTTTQESSTTEQTTTQLTTTQESTTSELTTTQEPLTSEQTTTMESTTSEQTTTDQSTSTEQSSSQESTTSEYTTTQSNENTTEESATTESTTEGNTTTEDSTDQSTTQTSNTESDVAESSPTTVEPSSSDKECPETDENQYLLVCPTSFKRHPKYCNMFYQCTEDDDTFEAKVAMFKCPNNTIYDEGKTQCVTEDKADEPCKGEIVDKRRFKRLGSHYKDPIVVGKGKLSCSTEGYFLFEKESECSKGFLKCEKTINGLIKGHIYQCPDGYIYWSISKRCERIESVRDCKRSSNDWTGRWNIPMEKKNVAAS